MSVTTTKRSESLQQTPNDVIVSGCYENVLLFPKRDLYFVIEPGHSLLFILPKAHTASNTHATVKDVLGGKW